MTTASTWVAAGRLSPIPWLLGYGYWVPAMVSLTASPLGMITIARVVEHRWLRPREQYLSFFYGDTLLAVAALAAPHLLDTADHLPAPLTSTWWAITCALMGLALGIVSWVLDARARRGDQPLYSRAQLLSPSKIWHNGICYVPIATVLGVVTVPALVATPWPGSALDLLLRLFIVIILVTWGISAFWWDPRHHKPNAHIDFEWRYLGRRPI